MEWPPGAARPLDTAVGVDLDRFGALHGLVRLAFSLAGEHRVETDDAFRRRLQMSIFVQEPAIDIDGLAQTTLTFTYMLSVVAHDPDGIKQGEAITVWCPGFHARPHIGDILEFMSDVVMKVGCVRMQPSTAIIAVDATLETSTSIKRLHEVFDRYAPPLQPTPL